MNHNFTFTSKNAVRTIERILELLKKKRLSNVSLADEIGLHPRTVRFYVNYLRDERDRRVRIGDFDVQNKGCCRIPLYEALAEGDPGPLLPDAVPPPSKRQSSNTEAHRQRERERREARKNEAATAARAALLSSIQPRRDPVVAAFFGTSAK